MSSECRCGHSEFDHKSTVTAGPHRGECLNCWCVGYTALNPPPAEVLDISEYTTLPSDAPVLDWIIERIERKGCPQGLNVLAEELQWMGQTSFTYDKLNKAVSAELRKPHSRLVLVSEGIYWLPNRNIPSGWSQFGKGSLPCFYREYPPAISWEKFELPENVLPRPKQHAHSNAAGIPRKTGRAGATR